jgi:hypothetical protein
MTPDFRRAWMILAALMLAPAGARAADGWTFAVTPYAWLPAMTTSVALARGTVESETSRSELLSELDFAFMGTVEGQKGRLGFLVDTIYVDLSETEDDVFRLPGVSADVGTRMLTVSAYATWRAVESPRGFLDLAAGIRYFDTTVSVAFSPAPLHRLDRTVETSWTEAIVGARGRYAFNDRWFASAAFDVGGFGGSDDSTWQALATVGYAFDDRWSVLAGWRRMDVQKAIDGTDVEIEMSGPIIGISYAF